MILMNIELVRLSSEYKEQLFEILTEWKNDIIVNHTDMSPWKIWANDFDNYLKNLDTKEETKNGWVPDTTLFCLDKWGTQKATLRRTNDRIQKFTRTRN